MGDRSFMETSNFRHVAQQSRREKLRVQNQDQFPDDHHTQDIAQLRSFRYGNLPYHDDVPIGYHTSSSEMINFASAASSSLMAAAAAHTHNSSKDDIVMSGDPQNCSTWKSIGSQEVSTCDWISDGHNSNPIFVGSQGLSASSFKSNYNVKPSSSYGYHHEVQQSSYLTSQPPSEMNYNHPSSLYHSPNVVPHHQEMVFTSIPQQNNREAFGNELVLLPAAWPNRDLDVDHREDLRISGNDHGSNNYAQALSLSLSSIPLHKNLHSGSGCYGDLNQDMKGLKSEYMCFDEKASYSGKGIENEDVVGNVATLGTSTRSGVGPLGPFTGYATILKSSRFLKPAQQLLEEFCNMVGPKSMKHLESPAGNLSNEIRASCNDFDATTESVAGGGVGRDSGGSSSTFYSSNNNSYEKMQEVGGSSNSNESVRPEYLQKKAKLLYMLEEVCRKYKQYNQQMQMVVSAFESVAGLSAATPYISLALKSISRHFRCLRSAISEQLKSVRKALGEDLSSPTTGTTSSSDKGDASMTSRLKLMDRTIQKQKAAGGFFDTQQHVWRPQRGLPERAVAILRAWLFDHFLHPYPTDADKHMLASQTGLSRNQVSNWFINARVRVWKPMVEEIHTLETKGSAEAGSAAGKPNEKTSGGVRINVDEQSSNDDPPSNRLNTTSGFSQKPVEESMEVVSSGFIDNRMNNVVDAWNQKRSRVECHSIPAPGPMDASLVSFSPYQQSGIDIGSLGGAVSLTLGLRRNVDGLQPQQQQQHDHHHHLRRHFGDQMVYDFVG